MRLQHGVPVAGLDAGFARSMVRTCGGDLTRVAGIAERTKVGEQLASAALCVLESHGFVRRKRVYDEDRWITTTAGNALAMASFNKPIQRAKAEQLLAGVLERADAYNTDDTHLLFISRLRVFGSYLDPDADELGDIDLAVEFRDNAADSFSVDERARRELAFVHASGRRFSNIVEELDWPRREAVMILRNRSAYINITREDLDRLTDRSETVYEADSVAAG